MAYVPNKELILKWVESSRRAQGLPPTIVDVAFYAHVARILRTGEALRCARKGNTAGWEAQDSDLSATRIDDA